MAQMKYDDMPSYFYLKDLLEGIKKKKMIVNDGELDWNKFLK